MNKIIDFMRKNFLFIWFYIVWFACIYLAKKNFSFSYLFLNAVSIYAFFKSEKLSFKSAIHLVMLLLIGLIFDFLMIKYGFISIVNKSGIIFLNVLPLWLITIWITFTLSLPLMMRLIKMPNYILAFLGSVFGVFSYYNGIKLNVITFDQDVTFAFYAIFWGIYMLVARNLLKVN